MRTATATPPPSPFSGNIGFTFCATISRAILFEHLAIERQERAQCLILRGCSDVLVGREITQKGAHLLGTHFFGVTFPMEQDEALNPVHVYLFSVQRIMLKPYRTADQLEQVGSVVSDCLR